MNQQLVSKLESGENINEGMVSIPRTGSNNYSKSAKDTRDDFKEHFNSQQGAVNWLMDMVTRTLHAFDEQFQL